MNKITAVLINSIEQIDNIAGAKIDFVLVLPGQISKETNTVLLNDDSIAYIPAQNGYYKVYRPQRYLYTPNDGGRADYREFSPDVSPQEAPYFKYGGFLWEKITDKNISNMPYL